MKLQKGFSRVRTVLGGIVKDQKKKGNVGTANLIAAAPELLQQVNSIIYCFASLLSNPKSIPKSGGWDREKLEEWKKELDELVINAEGK